MTHPDPTRPTSTTGPEVPEHAAHPSTLTPPTSPTRGAAYPAWLRSAVREASRMELPYEPVFAHSSLDGRTLLTALSRLGAELELDERRIGWHVCGAGGSASYELPSWMRREEPECEVSNFCGVVRFTLDGDPWVAGRLPRRRGGLVFLESLLGGPSLATLLELEGRLREAASELQADRLQVFGSRLALGEIPDVAASDLVLSDELETEIFSFLDRFEREVRRDGPVCGRSSRGLLFMGRPGTGKTLTIAHILGRLSGCRRYLFVPAAVGELNLPERRFEDLVRTIGALARPAVVVVEDIDRLFQAGTVTPQYFLNVLDGMLRPGTPTLWIATCNDPSDLPENLTDRPGRFDRILVFEEPGPGERTELLRLYARTPLPGDRLAALAREANGLTGAHIAEACRSAAVDVDVAAGGDAAVVDADGARGGDPAVYAERLAAELDALRRQQGAAKRYGRMLRGEAVGF